MKIKYRIIETYPEEHSIVVRYFTDIFTEEELAIDKNSGIIQRREDGTPARCRTDVNINIFQIPPPVGEELHKFILQFAPVSFFELQEKIKNPEIDTSLSSLADLIGKTFEGESIVPINSAAENIESLSEEEIEKMIDGYLKENG